jgi:DMSO/TMAO reductase YedYZ molybdopterin-dependent catalytic subunit
VVHRRQGATGGPGGSGGEYSRLPPGQYVPRGWPVLHYGRVPKFRPGAWDFRVFGACARETTLSWPEFEALPRVEVVADFHCVTKFSVLGNRWSGVSTRAVLDLVPPQPEVTHVMVWAEYGYSTNMTLADFAATDSLFAMARDGEPLTPDHGYPVRLVVPRLYAWKGPKWVRGVEYLTEDRRGFWEQRGYHNGADPWQEQRYSYQEEPGDGPPG